MDAPTFTQVPNVLFDEWLSEIQDDCELRIVLIVTRLTFGWRTGDMRLGFKEIARRAKRGMTVPEVLRGLTLALEHGYIERHPETGHAGSYFRIPVTGRCTNRFSARDALDPSDILSMPARPPTKAINRKSTPPKSTAPTKTACDASYISELQADPAYEGIDVKREYMKMVRWCKTNRKQPSRRRLVNWLNGKDVPLKGDAVDETTKQTTQGYETAAARSARLLRERHADQEQ